jgi:hypothetical protein
VGLSAARFSPRLLAELGRIDDGRLPVAEVNRRLGAAADRLGVRRPSYERVRILVRERHSLRAQPTTLDVILDISTRARPPEAFLDHISGIGVPRLP